MKNTVCSLNLWLSFRARRKPVDPGSARPAPVHHEGPLLLPEWPPGPVRVAALATTTADQGGRGLGLQMFVSEVRASLGAANFL